MLKQQIILEVKKGENTYLMQLPQNCALGEVHDVLYQMRTFVIERILEEQKKDKPIVPEIDKAD